jgi:hypothetical protein
MYLIFGHEQTCVIIVVKPEISRFFNDYSLKDNELQRSKFSSLTFQIKSVSLHAKIFF